MSQPILPRFQLLLILCAIGLLLFVGRLASRDWLPRPLLAPGDYNLSGSFVPGGTYAGTRWMRKEDEQFSLGSQAGSDQSTGEFVSATFVTPAELSCFLSGYPNHEGNAFYLESDGDSKRLNLGVRVDPGDRWRQFSWTLPRQWRGQRVRLV